jgi:cob(I)alamin adenosyltransferase
MKLYTKRGDAGQTDLFTGQRVTKDSLRVEAYGTVDELNSQMGLAVAACDEDDQVIRPALLDGQSRLFDLGADLAAPPEDASQEAIVPRITDEQVTAMEAELDRVSGELPAMKHFILPGGTELAARLHVARTVCRRAERICVALQQHEGVSPAIIVYLNRLSDLLFAFARLANHRDGRADVPWQGRGEPAADEEE